MNGEEHLSEQDIKQIRLAEVAGLSARQHVSVGRDTPVHLNFSGNEYITGVLTRAISFCTARWVKIFAELHHENIQWERGIESRTVPWRKV